MTIALHGGKPVRTTQYPQWPQFDRLEEQALQRALHQGQWWRASGKECEAFEREFAAHHGASHAFAVTNGTHALQLALQVAGIGAGDEVLVPAFTFISTSLAVQHVGATPVLVDVDLDTYCMSPAATRAMIGPRTKAMIPVHMCGHFAAMKELGALAAEHGLVLIQDAAHAHGAIGPEGKRVGEWNSMACFSFQNFKLMTAGEGGLVLCPDAETAERAYLFANCGRPRNDTSYMHTVSGSNFRMSEFSAAVLRAQLTRLEQQTDKRESNAAAVSQRLAEIPGLIPQAHTAIARRHPHYMLMFRLDREVFPDVDRNLLVKALVAEGIPAYRAYEALFRIPAFYKGPVRKESAEDIQARCPASDTIARDAIWIHHRALLGSQRDALDIVSAVEKVLDAGLDVKELPRAAIS